MRNGIQLQPDGVVLVRRRGGAPADGGRRGRGLPVPRLPAEAGGAGSTPLKFFEKIAIPIYAFVTYFPAKDTALIDPLTGHG
jgi:hypothetical protein